MSGQVVLFGMRAPAPSVLRHLGVRACEMIRFMQDGKTVTYRRNILFKGNPTDEPLLSVNLKAGAPMMSHLYCHEREAMDRIHYEPPERLRERLSVLNRLPLTPDRQRLRAAIVRLLKGN